MGRSASRLGWAAGFLFVGLISGRGFAADAPIRLDERWKEQSLHNRLFFFAGGDIAGDSHFAWSGVVGAPGGLLQEDGWRFRLAAGAGRYRYRTGAAAGGTNKADIVSGEWMLGYRFTHADLTATAFAGAHIENRQLHAPDPGHRAQGTAIGVKGLIELYRRFTPRIFGTASASASTVHRAYHLRAALAHEFKPAFASGFEAVLLGDVRYAESRAGVFVQSTYGRTTLSLAGGMLSNSGKGNGGYAALAVHAAY